MDQNNITSNNSKQTCEQNNSTNGPINGSNNNIDVKEIKEKLDISLTNKTNSVEVQKHGFIWEAELCKNVFLASDDEYKSIPYTCKYDLPAIYNHLDNINLSIKTTCSKNNICMADCLTLYEIINSGDVMHLCVIIYKQINNKKILENIIEIDLTGLTKELFGTLTYDEIKKYATLIKSIETNRRPTTEENKTMNTMQKALQLKSGAIKLNRKIDSKTQRRLQCSFNKFQLFISNNKNKIVAQSNTEEFRDGKIRKELISERRKFNKK